MAARLPSAFFGMFLLSLLVAPAHGGTASAPEISDPSEDQAIGGAVPVPDNAAATNADVEKAWVADAGDALTFTIRIQGPGTSSAAASNLYTFHFQVAGTDYTATGLLDIAAPAGTGGIMPGGAATAAVAAGNNLIVLTVPKEAIGNPTTGTVVGNLYVMAEAKYAGAETTIQDRAPDADYGTAFVIPDNTPPVVRVRTTLSNATVEVAHGFSNATTALYVYTWTLGPAQSNLALDVEGSGNVTVQVRDASNTTLYRRAWLDVVDFEGGQALAGAAGNWTITLDYVGFEGELKLSLELPPPPTGTHATTPGPTTTGTGTPRPPSSSSTSSTSEGIPGFGVALAAAGLALAAARRRLA